MRLIGLNDDVPTCPLCEGPCTHEFERGPYQIGGNMPRPDPANASADPEPVKIKKPNRRGKRAIHGPEQDRMRRPSEDRSA